MPLVGVLVDTDTHMFSLTCPVAPADLSAFEAEGRTGTGRRHGFGWTDVLVSPEVTGANGWHGKCCFVSKAAITRPIFP